MSAGAAAARALLERPLEHPVVSLFLDLDPAEFATAAARSTQVNSLLDRARREIADERWDHEDRVALQEDLAEIESYFGSSFDPSGARALAVYCSRRDGLFETTPLPRPVSPDVVIEAAPAVEPLIGTPGPSSWCVTLISRREARMFSGHGEGDIVERRFEDAVHGQHSRGGWSQANYERSVDADVDHHLRDSAERLFRLWRHEPFEALLLGGPPEVTAWFAEKLHSDLRRLLSEPELALDVALARETDVREALAPVLRQWRVAAETEALRALVAKLDGGDGAAVSLAPTLAALAERRVQTLVLAPSWDDSGGRCPSCGLLYGPDTGRCPADGSELAALASLRPAVVRAALEQDADVIRLDDLDERAELQAFGGIGALLRY